jgi:hypothetical protein
MEPSEWATSTDLNAMLTFLNTRGLPGALWLFTVRCCQRVEKRLPGKVFREVLSIAEDRVRGSATWEMLDEAPADAATRLDKLTAKYQEMEDGEEYERLGRKLDAAQAVFVFQHQDGLEAAEAISHYFFERAEDRRAEESRQAELLRGIVPDPMAVLNDDEQDEE